MTIFWRCDEGFANVRRCTEDEHWDWILRFDRLVSQTKIGLDSVFTIFIGVDTHLFETRIHSEDPKLNRMCFMAATVEDARANHDWALVMVKG